MSATTDHSPLHDHVAQNDTFYRIYERYKPPTDVIAEIHEALPQARVIVATRYTCPDCARNVPRMARIAEHLPGWSWEIVQTDVTPEQMHALRVVRVPTFIVYGESGLEIGRIVENPASGSLAKDLLAIVQPG